MVATPCDVAQGSNIRYPFVADLSAALAPSPSSYRQTLVSYLGRVASACGAGSRRLRPNGGTWQFVPLTWVCSTRGRTYTIS